MIYSQRAVRPDVAAGSGRAVAGRSTGRFGTLRFVVQALVAGVAPAGAADPVRAPAE